MPSQGWAQLLNGGAPWQTTQGTALTTATTATISPQAPTTKDFAIQTAYLYPGAVFRLTAHGFITSTATSTTATFLLAAGATPTTLATTAGFATSTTVITGAQWRMEAIARVTAIASTGSTVSTQGLLMVSQNPATAQTLNTASANLTMPMPNASGETAAAIDTTTAMAIMLRATLAGANATIQCTQFLVESLD